MKLTQAGRHSPVRVAALSVAARYAALRAYDENAGFIALAATLASSLILVVVAIVLRG